MTESTPDLTPIETLCAYALALALSTRTGGYIRVHGHCLRGPASQIRAEGRLLPDNTFWTLDLATIKRAIESITTHPSRSGQDDASDTATIDQLRSITTRLTDPTNDHTACIAELSPVAATLIFDSAVTIAMQVTT